MARRRRHDRPVASGSRCPTRPRSARTPGGLTPERRKAVMSPARRLLVRATAGWARPTPHAHPEARGRRRGRARPGPGHDLHPQAGEESRRRLARAGVRDLRRGTFHRRRARPVTRYREDHTKPLTPATNRRRLVGALVDQLRKGGAASSRTGSCHGSSRRSGGRSARASTARPTRRARDASTGPRRWRRRSSPSARPLRRVVREPRRARLRPPARRGRAAPARRRRPARRVRHQTHATFVDETQHMNPLQFLLLCEMAVTTRPVLVRATPTSRSTGSTARARRSSRSGRTRWSWT